MAGEMVNNALEAFRIAIGVVHRAGRLTYAV
jgi:hypothetical protein